MTVVTAGPGPDTEVLDPADAAVRPPRGRREPAAHAAVLVVALGMWAWSLPRIDVAAMTDLGLISVLPAAFFAGTALLCAGFAVSATRRAPPAVLLGYAAAMLVVLHATVALVYREPHYPYVYKHLAVIRYILENGSVDRTVDIYHNWPGTFAAAAVLSELTGLDPAVYANWAELFFAVAGALGTYAVARALGADQRRAAAVVWVYVVVSCTTQTYLSPQSTAFFLAMLAVALVAAVLRPRSARSVATRIVGLVERVMIAVSRLPLRVAPGLRRVRLLPERAVDRPTAGTVDVGADPFPLPRWFAAGLVVAMAAAISVTHQLSPVFLILLLAALLVLGRTDSWWLLVVVGLMAVAWVAASYAYLSLHFDLFTFDPAANVQGTQSDVPGEGSAGHRIVSGSARVMMALIVLAAGLAWWRAGWRAAGARQTWVWGLVVAPALVLGVQSYGGEALYRVVMFGMPFLAYLAARPVVPERVAAGARGAARTVGVAVASTVAAGLFLLNYYGLDQINHLSPQEVRASTWFEENTPPGSVLGMLNGYWPTPVTARYPVHQNVDGNWGAPVYSDPHFTGYVGRALTAADITPILETMRSMSEGPVYIGYGPVQRASLENLGYAPPGSVDAFMVLLRSDPRVRTAYVDGDAIILQVLPVASL